jgi:hypothetical protein
VILDFKRLEVVKATMDGTTIPKDFNRVVEYYYQYYQSTIDRLFAENGLEVVKNEPTEEVADEKKYLEFISRNPALDFLNEPEEDVYSSKDGKPFQH